MLNAIKKLLMIGYAYMNKSAIAAGARNRYGSGTFSARFLIGFALPPPAI